MIYVLYGQPGSGKTSLGKLLASHLDTPFIIDGDEFRGMFTNKNYGKEGREENIRNANAVATYLNKKGKAGNWAAIYCRDGANSIKGHPVSEETHVVMCLVNPYEHLRRELDENNKGEVIEVLLQSNRELRKEYHVEDFEFGNPKITINTDKEVNRTWESLISRVNKKDYHSQ
jgi:tRNA uridine 5-carbamoylmethylation protein Kti12